MKNGNMLLNVVILSSISVLITIVTYFVNIWLFSSYEYFSPTDAFFVEGLIFLLSGILLLLGRGGINLWSQRAAILSALAGAVFDEDTVGPSEIYRRDKWKPKGFIRIALILIFAGVFMIMVYFLTI